MLIGLKGSCRSGPNQQFSGIERKKPWLEERLERLISRIGFYGMRNDAELKVIIADPTAVLDILDKIITASRTEPTQSGSELFYQAAEE